MITDTKKKENAKMDFAAKVRGLILHDPKVMNLLSEN